MTTNNLQSNSPFGDRRTALAFFLSLIVIITYTELVIKPQQVPLQTPPNETELTTPSEISTIEDSRSGPQIASPEQVELKNAQEKSVEDSNTAEVAQTAKQERVRLPADVPTPQEIADALSTTIITPQYRATITHLGARLHHFELLQHTKSLDSDEPMDLIFRSKQTPLPLGVSLLGGTDAKINFPAPTIQVAGKPTTSKTITLDAGQEARIAFQVPLTDGGTYTKSFRFNADNYLIDVQAKLSELPSASSAPLTLNWDAYYPEEVAASSYDPVSFSLFLSTDDVEHLPVSKFEEAEKQEKLVRWASLGDKYFMASFISNGNPTTASLSRNKNEYHIAAQGTQQVVDTKVFIGPKNYSDLKQLGYEMHRNVNFGIFSLLSKPLLTVIHFFYGLFGNYGLAIIALTLLIKLLFLPLTQVSFKSMKAMQDLQPEIKALRERISDPNQLNQEIFALYKRKGVNPMGGCFPMLIQIPVFLGLYNALLNATELRHSPFALWITDLSAPEALVVAGIPIPVMILLMGISMFFQQWLTPSNMDEQQKKIMMMMPIMFTVMFIIFPFPSGLVLYWLVNNLISIVQQVYLRTDRSVGPAQATIMASIGMFLIGYTLTLL